MDIKQALAHVVEQLDLSTEQMQDVFRQIMTGQCTDAQIGGFLVALRMKSETLDEIVGAALTMRELVTPVSVNADYLVDIVGTGGDGANIFNVSTASSFVAAAAGAHVAKHGNRAVSSKSGSADLLEAAGVNLGIGPEQVAKAVEQVGVGFMFAPAHHSAMKHAIGPRKELGMRTIFNILGPMTNPAGVKRLVIGVFNQALCLPLAQVLQRLGAEHIMVVHAEDGLDEISLAAPTHVAELKDDELREYVIKPEDFGIESESLIGLSVVDANDSLGLIKDALGPRSEKRGEKAASMIALNAGAAIYVSGLAPSLADGVRKARAAIHDGAALAKIEALAQFTQTAAA